MGTFLCQMLSVTVLPVLPLPFPRGYPAFDKYQAPLAQILAAGLRLALKSDDTVPFRALGAVPMPVSKTFSRGNAQRGNRYARLGITHFRIRAKAATEHDFVQHVPFLSFA